MRTTRLPPTRIHGLTEFRVAGVLCTVAVLGACAGLAEAPEPEGGRYGVLVMAHGGDDAWDQEVLDAVAPLSNEYPVAVALGMADAATLEQAVRELEAQSVGKIGVVGLFVSGESWYERTEQIFGLASGASDRAAGHAAGAAPVEASIQAEHQGHSMGFWRIDTTARFVMSRAGLSEAADMGAVLADRAKALSTDPSVEDVLVLAHGPANDAENERWLANIDTRAAEIRRARPFRRVEVHTLREDWPEKRTLAEERIRAFVQRAGAEGGRAIVIPFRVQGFGPYAQVLQGSDYISDGRGLLPHPLVTQWLRKQAEDLEQGPFRSPLR